MVSYRENIVVGVSWSGAFFGLIIGVTTYLLLTMLGVAIGGSAFSFNAAEELGWGALAWIVIASSAAAFLAGYTGTRATPAITTRSTGYCVGALAGALLLITLTFATVTSIASIGRAAMGMARSAAGALPDVNITDASRSMGFDPASLTRGFNRSDVENAIAQASPELDRSQVSAVSNAVITTINDSSRRIAQSVTTRPGDIDDSVRREFDSLSQQFSGPQFAQRLQQQGLSSEQANRTAGVIEQKVRDLRGQLEQAGANLRAKAEDVSKGAATAISRAAWGWLVIGLLVMGFSIFGGARGSDIETTQDLEQYERRQEERATMHH